MINRSKKHSGCNYENFRIMLQQKTSKGSIQGTKETLYWLKISETSDIYFSQDYIGSYPKFKVHKGQLHERIL